MAEQQAEQTDQAVARKTVKILLITGAVIMACLVLAAAIAGGAFLFAKQQFDATGSLAPSGSIETIFDLPRGQGLGQISQRLGDTRVISNSLIFRAGVVWYGAAGDLKAGEYSIPSRSSMRQIMELLRSGKSILYRITIPEGLTSAQVVRLVQADPILVGEAKEVPLEGGLLPETYLFQRGMSRSDMIEQMLTAHNNVLSELWQGRSENLPFSTPEEAVILASIVEKETAVAEERARVAAVFVNRLNRNMRLESDPTIIYGLTQGEPLGRGLRQSELKKVTPYNTYEVDGLPPTPIANAGRDSLAAVLNPLDTKELFFVADGNGGHVFAETYRQHRRNVAAWRRIERKRATQP